MENNDNQFVVLVDQKDRPVGRMPKLEAHQKGVLHRAFSVFILNSKHELLLQRRAVSKYHSPNLWSNTCCSHPYVGELVIDAANRRLKEEMGLDTPLEYLFHFIYHQEVGNGLIEHELDHVYYGFSDNDPKINPLEVSQWKWMTLKAIENELLTSPNDFTIWMRIIFPQFYQVMKTEIEF
ncbi:MAG: isopentenyl-diphosphate Delta-isomerase [Flavobacteriaceae bacterium]|nr:isopentenyl-diphosphate Delta-isomerase [Flavobacteriaceae bacterium]MCY4216270.1 isopentenyl-diphosphate Delta-isomerase [Flavobacteriaceae bacterium]MCY4253115.1 isopentenyl-diphosphate Delta-isomerase [Flavobacteriaceae bacterium]